MHLADSVWSSVERHLFRDESGKLQGLLHVGRWFDFSRLPGRARSHTRAKKWETFRLHGTLAGHRAAYTDSSGSFYQPRTMRVVEHTTESWWSHSGPLAVVFSGLGVGEIALPVRLPAAPANQAALDHYLSDPDKWHKIDLVRRRDQNAPGGWRYEAHLMVLTPPYVSPATTARRAQVAREMSGRSAGIDVNVSNVTVASHADGADLRITRVERDAGDRAAGKQRARLARRRARGLERSRRAANPDQYYLSERQLADAHAREVAGRAPRPVIPKGPRKATSGGRPLQPFRKDALTARYRRDRAAHTAEAAAASRARKDNARKLAGELTLRHGFKAVIEDCNLTAWARRWGRALHAFSPGTLVAALERESRAIADVAGKRGGMLRASTATALSQRCLCGERVEKCLADRVHRCPRCALSADRDAMSAVLASIVRFRDETSASSAFVDDALAGLLREAEGTTRVLESTLVQGMTGRQDARSESTASSARKESFLAKTERTSQAASVMARRNVGTALRATPDETGASRTTLERAQTRTNLSHGNKLLPLRDSS